MDDEKAMSGRDTGVGESCSHRMLEDSLLSMDKHRAVKEM